MSVTAVPIAPVKRGYLVWLWVGLAVAVAAGIALAFLGTSAVVADRGDNAQFLAWNARQPGVEQTASGLQYRLIEAGEGATPTETDLALVNYAGRLRDGTVFDASQQPTPFPVAEGATVPGFSEALKLMPKGARYRFWIPSELGYGATPPTDPRTGESAIPADAVLIFDVEMVDFVSEAVVRQLQQQQMQQQLQGMGAPPAGAPAPPQ